MRRITLPVPPDPTDRIYQGNPLAWNRALADWMAKTKGIIEGANLGRPTSQPFAKPTSFTTNTTVTGTTTGTDLSNVVCSLIQTLINRGILPTGTAVG